MPGLRWGWDDLDPLYDNTCSQTRSQTALHPCPSDNIPAERCHLFITEWAMEAFRGKIHQVKLHQAANGGWDARLCTVCMQHAIRFLDFIMNRKITVNNYHIKAVKRAWQMTTFIRTVPRWQDWDVCPLQRSFSNVCFNIPTPTPQGTPFCVYAFLSFEHRSW